MSVHSLRPTNLSALFVALLCVCAAVAPALAQQKQQTQAVAASARKAGDATGEAAQAPPYQEYKGVRLGMTADEARRKLGNAQEKSDQQDVYSFSGEKELAQIYYQDGKVSAISVTYINAGSAAPTAQSVFGEAVESKQDGSVYRAQTYQKAGYHLYYTRTAGDEPMVVVTMKKID